MCIISYGFISLSKLKTTAVLSEKHLDMYLQYTYIQTFVSEVASIAINRVAWWFVDDGSIRSNTSLFNVNVLFL